MRAIESTYLKVMVISHALTGHARRASVHSPEPGDSAAKIMPILLRLQGNFDHCESHDGDDDQHCEHNQEDADEGSVSPLELFLAYIKNQKS